MGNRKALLLGVAAIVCVAIGAAVLVLKPWRGKAEPKKLVVPPPSVAPKEREPSAEEKALKLIADQAADYSQRVRAVEKLGLDLKPALLTEVIRLVRDPAVHETIRNDLLNRLEIQEKPLGNLGPMLMEMRNDPKQSVRWRNYCLQHMAAAWKLEPHNRPQLAEALFGVLGQEKGAEYETAMLSLERVGASDPAVAGKVRQLALGRLEDARKAGWQGDSAETAVTALNLAANAGDRSVLADARKLAADKGVLARLRMAALAALGQLGDQSDVELLTTLASGPEGRIQTAAKLNLQTLKKRLGETSGGQAPAAEKPRP